MWSHHDTALFRQTNELLLVVRDLAAVTTAEVFSQGWEGVLLSQTWVTVVHLTKHSGEQFWEYNICLWFLSVSLSPFSVHGLFLLKFFKRNISWCISCQRRAQWRRRLHAESPFSLFSFYSQGFQLPWDSPVAERLISSSARWADKHGHRYGAFVADEQLLLTSSRTPKPSVRTTRSSLSVAALGWSSGAEGRAEVSPVAPPVPAQDKVIVGRSAHGVKHIGFVGDLELWGRKEWGDEVVQLFSLSLSPLLPFLHFLRVVWWAILLWKNYEHHCVQRTAKLFSRAADSFDTVWKHDRVLWLIWIIAYYRWCRWGNISNYVSFMPHVVNAWKRPKHFLH